MMHKYELLVGNTSITIDGIDPKSAIIATNIFGRGVIFLEKVRTKEGTDAWIVQIEVQGLLTVAYIKCLD